MEGGGKPKKGRAEMENGGDVFSLSLPSEVSVAAAGGRRGGEEEGGIVNDQYRVGSLLSWQPTDPSLSLLFHSRRKPTLAVSFHFSRFSFISFLHALGSLKKK